MRQVLTSGGSVVEVIVFKSGRGSVVEILVYKWRCYAHIPSGGARWVAVLSLGWLVCGRSATWQAHGLASNHGQECI